jgi:hypothetical protein
MTKWNWKKILFVILLLLAGLFFVFDPFDWWPMTEVGKPCSPMSLYPRCTGKINFF